jgi:hypothetical protein
VLLAFENRFQRTATAQLTHIGLIVSCNWIEQLTPVAAKSKSCEALESETKRTTPFFRGSTVIQINMCVDNCVTAPHRATGVTWKHPCISGKQMFNLAGMEGHNPAIGMS